MLSVDSESFGSLSHVIVFRREQGIDGGIIFILISSKNVGILSSREPVLKLEAMSMCSRYKLYCHFVGRTVSLPI